MMKRVFLFLAVNLLTMMTIGVVLSLLGVRPYLTRYGIDYEQLAIFCLVWGMGGSLISLAMSRIMAKMWMGVQVIDPNTRDPELRQLLQTVSNLAISAGLPMPEVGIYDSPDVNAFATGPMKSRALVAVSSGLLERMNQSEIEGVLGHELSHVANGDMITMMLLQGVINAFVLFLSKVLAFAIDQAMRGDSREERRGPSMFSFVLEILFQIVFSILGSMVVAWFSRKREFRADAGSAKVAGRGKMIAALKALQRVYEAPFVVESPEAPPSMKAFQISTPKKVGSRLSLFATHPALEDRIAALESLTSV